MSNEGILVSLETFAKPYNGSKYAARRHGMVLTRRTPKWIVVLAIFAAWVTCGPDLQAQEIRNGEALLTAMHDRYAGNWYGTVTFTQKSTTYNPDGTSKSETWYEAAMLPGKLRIDIGPPANGNGAIVADGTLTSFKNGDIAATRPLVHMLLVLGFDVYRQPPQTTIDQAKGQGFDLTKLHEDTWDGQTVYVVGADKGDLKSKQFWIQKNNLFFVRMIEPDEKDRQKTNDTRFIDYRRLSVGWIAAGVEFYVDGKKVFAEEYSDIRANPKLSPAIFDPKNFKSEHWEK
jgi:outer membrane lipoprotein-sorting protein